MATSVEHVEGGKAWYHCDPPMVLGEAPIYRASDSTLHWVNCLSDPPELYKLQVDAITGVPQGPARVLQLSDSVSVHCFRKDKPGSFICAYYQGVAFMDEETGRLDVVKEIIPNEDRGIRRFNDGGVDAKGRFWLAEIDRMAKCLVEEGDGLPEDYGPPAGRVWRYDPDGSLHEMDSGFICGNGLAWSPDNKTMYINDSVGMKVYKYDFDLESGRISNRTVLVDHSSSKGEPDGMVVDTSGNLWNAVWGTNRVMVYSPDGVLLKEIAFSAKCVTCPTWGGRDNTFLYVTSAKAEAGAGDEGGNMFLYKASPGTQGVAKHEFAG